MWHPYAAIAGSGVAAAAAAIVGQVSEAGGASGADWANTGALGLLGSSGLMLVIGVLRGEIVHRKSEEREKEMSKLLESAHARELVHERFMTAAIDRLDQADRRRHDRDT